jgi:hypothetical protein
LRQETKGDIDRKEERERRSEKKRERPERKREWVSWREMNNA